MNKIKNRLKPYYHKLQNAMKFTRRFGLKNKNVSIISNNCAGGFISQYFGLPYNSPTAGLLIVGEDWLKFADNTAYYLTKKLIFIDPMDSKNLKLMRNTNNYGTYPVATCDDIEIFFMHYSTKEEAEDKWVRRSKRVNIGNAIWLLFESDLIPNNVVEAFSMSKKTNKMCFVYNEYANMTNKFLSKEVRDIPEHPWRPEIVVGLKNWKDVFNSLGE